MFTRKLMLSISVLILLCVTFMGCPFLFSGATPSVEITSHNDNDVVSTRAVTISGTVSSESSIESVKLSIDGGTTLATVNNGAFNGNINIVSEITAITVTATDSEGGSSSSSIMLHYLANTFSNDKVISDVAGGHDSGERIVIDNNDESFITGYSKNSSGNYDIAIWNLTSQGVLDTTFDNDGIAILENPAGGTGNDFGKDIVVDNSGSIYVVGSSINDSGDSDIVVAKYTSQGALDTTFGDDLYPADGTKDGFIVIDAFEANEDDSPNGVTLVDGNLYVASTSAIDGDTDVYVAKISTNTGVIDSTFNNNTGYAKYDSGSADSANDITADTTGNLYVTGSNGRMYVWKLSISGVTDTNFNGTGVVMHSGSSTGNGIQISEDNKIYVTGYVIAGAGDYDTAIWSYDLSGNVNSTFNSGFITRSGDSGKDAEKEFGKDIAFDSIGNIIVAGIVISSRATKVNSDMIVWKFSKTGILDTTFGNDEYPPDGTPDGFFIDYSSAGENNIDNAKGIAKDSKGNLRICGESIGTGTGSEMLVWTIE